MKEFDDYSTAVSIVTLLSTVVTLGLEKYALRAIALFCERQSWQKLHGFLLFSRSIIAGLGLILFILLAVSLEVILAWRGADYHIAIVIFSGFLPIIGIALFFVEVIASLGKQEIAFAIYRVLLPFLFLILVILVDSHFSVLTASLAVISFGLAWCAVLVVLWVLLKLSLPQISWGMPIITGRKWVRRSLPLVISSLLMTILTSSGVIILELIYPSGLQVGIYAVAAQTSSIINLIGTSTNRYYLPQMVVMLDKADKPIIASLMQQRFLVIGSLILLLFITIAIFGHDVLELFGHRFTGAYLTLVIISAGACFSAFYADIPYYLQYVGLNRLVVSHAAFAVLVMLFLAFFLGMKFGAVGVACAYTLPVSWLFLSYRWMMTKHILLR